MESLTWRHGGRLVFKVVDMPSFIDAAVTAPSATHFVVYGNRDSHKWFHPVARTRESPVIDVPKVTGGDLRRGDFIDACRLDPVARDSVRRFLRKAWRVSLGDDVWEWWLCADDHVLVGCHDGGDPTVLDRDLAAWSSDLTLSGVLRECQTD
jgi:hypothetical protein